jgi:dipeptidase
MQMQRYLKFGKEEISLLLYLEKMEVYMHTLSFRFFRILFILFLSYPSIVYSQQQECFLLMVGKEASADGKVLLAHNNDLSGLEASMLIRISTDEIINILPDNEISFNQSFGMLVLQTNLGFAEGDAVALNKHGVTIAGGMSLKRDRNSNAELIDPLVSSGLGGGVRYLALQHAKTARECVTLIGNLYNRYGIRYPSGIGIADTNEIWYMEAGGGHSWAAVRIPDNSYIVVANSYRIGKIDFNDTSRFICSPGLKSLSKKNGSNTNFNFSDFFGNGVKEKTGNNLYNSRRVWRTLDLLNPSMHFSPEKETFPLFLQPEKKIDLQKCFSILRDYYSGTIYDVYKNTNSQNVERSIAVWNTVHTDVISLSPGEPVDYGCIIWTGLSSPFVSVYIPVYYGCRTIPAAYEYAPTDFDKNSAFWIYKSMGDLCRISYPLKMKSWQKLRYQFESEEIELQKTIEKKAETLVENHHHQLIDYLETTSNKFSKDALKLASEMIDSLRTKSNE